MFKVWHLTKDWSVELQGERSALTKPVTVYFQFEILLTGKGEDHHGLKLSLQVWPFYGCLHLYNRHHAEWFVTGKEWPEGEEPLTLEEMAQNYIYSGELSAAIAQEGWEEED